MPNPRLVRAGALGALAAAAALWVTAPPGPALEPDSMSYIGAGRSLVQHGTLRVPWAHWPDADSTTALTDFPPGYPILLAAPLAVGASPQAAARVVTTLAMLAAVALLAVLAEVAAGPAAAILAAGLVIVAPAVVGVEMIVVSEPLYFACIALTLTLMLRPLEPPWRYGLSAAIASLVRYAGMSLIAAVTLWAFGRSRGEPMSARLRRAALAALPGLALQTAWALRIRAQGAEPPQVSFELYGGILGVVGRGLVTAAAWLVPGVPAGAARIAIAVLLVAMIALLLWHAVHPRLLAPLALVAVCYAAVLVYSRVMVGEEIEFDDRILTPIFLCASVAVAVGIVASWPGWQAPRRAVVGVLVALWIVVSARESIARVRSLRLYGYGYEGPDWRQSDMAVWLREQGHRYALFTNDPAAVYFLSGRPARLLPQTLAADSVRAFADTVRRRHGAVLGFETDFDYQAPPDSIAARLGLRPAVRFDYGTAWVLPQP